MGNKMAVSDKLRAEIDNSLTTPKTAGRRSAAASGKDVKAALVRRLHDCYHVHGASFTEAELATNLEWQES